MNCTLGRTSFSFTGPGPTVSSWNSVIERMQADGYHVTAPQFPLTSLADDVAEAPPGPGAPGRADGDRGHWYGGQVIAALGRDAPHVVGFVYIAAFGIDEGDHSEGCLQRTSTPAMANPFVD